jgi:DNA uptake protein ComE-like DNA-binding protein
VRIEHSKETEEKQEAQNNKTTNQVTPQNLPKTFDPNTYSEKDWEKIGFTPKQAKAIINYKEKLGGFDSTDDFKKIYVVADTMYQKLAPRMKFNNSQEREEEQLSSQTTQDLLAETEKNEEQFSFPININQADEASLKTINGIGPYYAKLILQYRDDLGGFINTYQFAEIKKLPTELKDTLKKYTTIDTAHLKRIDLNNEQHLQNLHQHPYISKSIAHSLKILKQQNGTFTQKEDILQSPYIDIELYKKISPYIAPP